MSSHPEIPQTPSIPQAPAVAIIVTHYKSPDALRASLESLRDHADLAHTEVVVADSETQPGTQALVAHLVPQARYLGFDDDVGYAVSVNAALEVTTAPLIMVINADVRIEQGTLEELQAALRADEQLGLVGPLLSYDDGTPQISAFRFYRPTTVLHRRTFTGETSWGRAALVRFTEPGVEANRSNRPVPADWVLGAAIMVRRSALETVGRLETRYFMYFEDVDLCLRLWHRGWKVAAVPTAHARHTYGKASRGKGPKALLSNQMARIHVRAAIIFFWLHGVHPSREPRRNHFARSRDRGRWDHARPETATS